jgi:hypothetical protein
MCVPADGFLSDEAPEHDLERRFPAEGHDPL